mmetsp:Transcript_24862/g.54972  ORF Transcript_24862/g.54972 Transcript_24862/m.54972 type:complete len:219 (-) Transcript_24862:62-718(-)
MFAAMNMCCCTENQENDNITFHSTTDERQGRFPDEVPLAQQSPSHADYAPQLVASTPLASGSARSLSAKEKEAEKLRLQNLVNSFAKKAVKGCSCTYVKEGTGERATRHYRIDRSLEFLLVVDPEAAATSSPEVTCPIAAIQDIYACVEDGEQCFPPQVVSALEPEELDLLLMVVYRSGQDKMFRFCILEETPESRDTFLESLRILCIYAQSNPGMAS